MYELLKFNILSSGYLEYKASDVKFNYYVEIQEN